MSYFGKQSPEIKEGSKCSREWQKKITVKKGKEIGNQGTSPWAILPGCLWKDLVVKLECRSRSDTTLGNGNLLLEE